MFEEPEAEPYHASTSSAAGHHAKEIAERTRPGRALTIRDLVFGGSTEDASPNSSQPSPSLKTSRAGKADGCALCGGACTNSDIIRPHSEYPRKASARRISATASSLPPGERGSPSSAPMTYQRASVAASPSATSATVTTSNVDAPAHTMTDTTTETNHGAPWPTPCASSCKGLGPKGSKSHRERLKRFYLDAVVQEAHGIQTEIGIELNPYWVEPLMGFPIGWTEVQASLFDGLPDAEATSTHGSRPASLLKSHSKTPG